MKAKPRQDSTSDDDTDDSARSSDGDGSDASKRSYGGCGQANNYNNHGMLAVAAASSSIGGCSPPPPYSYYSAHITAVCNEINAASKRPPSPVELQMLEKQRRVMNAQKKRQHCNNNSRWKDQMEQLESQRRCLVLEFVQLSVEKSALEAELQYELYLAKHETAHCGSNIPTTQPSLLLGARQQDQILQPPPSLDLLLPQLLRQSSQQQQHLPLLHYDPFNLIGTSRQAHAVPSLIGVPASDPPLGLLRLLVAMPSAPTLLDSARWNAPSMVYPFVAPMSSVVYNTHPATSIASMAAASDDIARCLLLSMAAAAPAAVLPDDGSGLLHRDGMLATSSKFRQTLDTASNLDTKPSVLERRNTRFDNDEDDDDDDDDDVN